MFTLSLTFSSTIMAFEEIERTQEKREREREREESEGKV
jgi:hypothetical protein